MRQTLSAVIITKNEEANIRECLESVKWADEIVVVDSASRDATEAICREYTDKIFSRPMDGFGAQKQYAIEKASCDWILSLDADERVSPELAAGIRHILETPSRYAGYRIWRKTYYLGVWMRYCGWYNPVARLFKKGSGRTDMKYVHEEILVNGEIGEIREPIVHYSYDSLDQHVKKLAVYTGYDSRLLYERGVRVTARNMIWYCAIKPVFIFIRKYIVQGGILAGARGFLISALAAVAVFLNYAKVWEIQARSKVSRHGTDGESA